MNVELLGIPHAYSHQYGFGADAIDPDNLPPVVSASADKPAATDVPPGTYWFNSDGSVVDQSDGTNWNRAYPPQGIPGIQHDRGVAYETVSLEDCTTELTVTTQKIFLVRQDIPITTPPTGNLDVGVSMPAPTGLSGLYFGTYDSGGNLLAASVDVSSSFMGFGLDLRRQVSGAAPQIQGRTLGGTVPFVWYAILCAAATTQLKLIAKPVYFHVGGVIRPNLGLSNSQVRIGTYNVGAPTTLPSTLTLSSIQNYDTDYTGIPYIGYST